MSGQIVNPICLDADAAPASVIFYGWRRLKRHMALDLEALLKQAHQQGAQKLLVLANQPPVYRKDGKLSQPLLEAAVSWDETQSLATELLSEDQFQQFDQHGSAEGFFAIGGISGQLTVFYGNASANLVFHLQ